MLPAFPRMSPAVSGRPGVAKLGLGHRHFVCTSGLRFGGKWEPIICANFAAIFLQNTSFPERFPRTREQLSL